MWGDVGYQGVDKRLENRELDVEWRVAMRPGRRRHLEPGSYEALAEKRKASVRAKVEHPFLYVKRRFGCAKVRYRGLAKNAQRLALLLGLANLMTAERRLAASEGRSAQITAGSRDGSEKPLRGHNRHGLNASTTTWNVTKMPEHLQRTEPLCLSTLAPSCSEVP